MTVHFSTTDDCPHQEEKPNYVRGLVGGIFSYFPLRLAKLCFLHLNTVSHQFYLMDISWICSPPPHTYISKFFFVCVVLPQHGVRLEEECTGCLGQGIIPALPTVGCVCVLAVWGLICQVVHMAGCGTLAAHLQDTVAGKVNAPIQGTVVNITKVIERFFFLKFK